MHEYFINKEKKRKKISFRITQFFAKLILYHRPKFIFLGDSFIESPFVLLSNHVGSKVGPKIDNYFPHKQYMWGTYEMTGKLKDVRKYLVHIYYHQKKKVPLFFAQIIGTIFSPFAYMYYQGIRLIPTYPDSRFVHSISLSLEAMNNGNSITIYPEDSSEGYKDVLTKLFSGFVILCEARRRKGMDTLIYVTYYQKKKNRFIVDEPISYQSLYEEYKDDRDLIAEKMRLKMNALKDYKYK